MIAIEQKLLCSQCLPLFLDNMKVEWQYRKRRVQYIVFSIFYYHPSKNSLIRWRHQRLKILQREKFSIHEKYFYLISFSENSTFKMYQALFLILSFYSIRNYKNVKMLLEISLAGSFNRIFPYRLIIGLEKTL